MVRGQRRLARSGASLTTQAISDAAIRDRDEPRPERTRWIVGLPHGVHCQQDILYRVLQVARVAMQFRRQRTHIRRDFPEKARIGLLVSSLRVRHEDRPVQFSSGHACRFSKTSVGRLSDRCPRGLRYHSNRPRTLVTAETHRRVSLATPPPASNKAGSGTCRMKTKIHETPELAATNIFCVMRNLLQRRSELLGVGLMLRPLTRKARPWIAVHSPLPLFPLPWG